MRISCGIGGLSTEINGRLARHSPIPMASNVVVLVGSCFLPSVRSPLFSAPTQTAHAPSFPCAASGVTANVSFAGGFVRSDKLPDNHIASASHTVEPFSLLLNMYAKPMPFNADPWSRACRSKAPFGRPLSKTGRLTARSKRKIELRLNST